MNLLASFNQLKDRFGFLAKAQKTILSAAVILALSSGTTAILGLFKNRLLASYFGVSNVLGIFYTADRVPNIVYSVLVVGALSTIFIPVFTESYKTNKNEAFKAGSSIILMGLLIFLVLSTIVIFAANPIIFKLSLGAFSPDEVALGAKLMRIMMLAQVILVISSFLSSILQSFKLFLMPALAPIVYNLGLIVGTATLSKSYGIYGPAYGVILGAVLHLLIQVPALLKTDFKFSFNINFENEDLKKMAVLIPPRILSILITQAISTINNSLAILISTSSVVILKFSSQLQFFPVHLFGASIATAALPVLSEYSTDKTTDRFKSVFITSLHQLLFLVLPASMLFVVLRIPIIRLVYGVSNFSWEATVKTSYALAFFSISIFSQSVFYLLTRAYFALKDTYTPVVVSLLTIVLNISMSTFFVKYLHLGVWSLALTYSLTSLLDVICLTYLLSKKLGGFRLDQLLVPFIKTSYATIFMGISLYIPLKLLDQFVFDTTRTLSLLILTGLVSTVGIVVYFGFTYLFKVKEIELFYRILRHLNISGTQTTLETIENEKHMVQ